MLGLIVKVSTFDDIV